MKASACIFLSITLLFVCISNTNAYNLQASIKCFHEKNYRFYDFKPLMKSDNLTYSIEYTDEGISNRIEFDFCESLPSANRCKDEDSMAVVYDTQAPKQNTCHSLTQKPGKGENVTLVETKNQDDEHLILNYSTTQV